MTVSGDDPWSIGSLFKLPIWVFYSISNFVGVILCGLLLWSIIRNKKRDISDIFVGGVALGCFEMSLTCGTQCAINAIAGRFQGEEVACYIEAIAHVSSILMQFFCVAGISFCLCFQVIYSQAWKQHRAQLSLYMIRLVGGLWVFCTLVTGLLSLTAPIYLMSAGTYCFFSFSSFAIAGWLVPGLVISMISMVVCHCIVLHRFRQMLPSRRKDSVEKNTSVSESHNPQPITTTRQILERQFKSKSITFILLLLLGWGFAVGATIHELTTGQSSEWLVTAVGVGGVSFSWAMPATYVKFSLEYRWLLHFVLGRLLIPCLGKKWWISQQTQLSEKLNPDQKSHHTTAKSGDFTRGSAIPSETIAIIEHPPQVQVDYPTLHEDI